MVTVRETNHPDYPGGFVVKWPGAPDAKGRQKRRAKYFANLPDAEEWAKDRRAELGDVGKSFGSISEPERAAVTFWRGFVERMTETPPPPLLSVLMEYERQWKITRASVTVAHAVERYEATKRAEGLRPVSLQSIKTRCARFVRDMGERPISSITPGDVSDWLLSLRGKGGSLGLQGRRNHRLALSGLFTFALSRGWVEKNPVMAATKFKRPALEPGILRPGEVARLFGALEKAAPALIPFWAVKFFAGIRDSEALRLDWRFINLPGREITVNVSRSKTNRSRDVKIEPVLAAFLAPHVRASGPIVTPSDQSRRYQLAKALRILQAEDAAATQKAQAAGKQSPASFPQPMPFNAARHSFASFHLMAFRNAGETALQLGHGESPELLFRHYKGIATEAEAKAFWSIRPKGKLKNVLPFAPAKAAVAWPPAQELQRMLWERPAVEIAAELGVSDVALTKHAKRHGLSKPPRGYWASKKAAR